MDTHTVLGNNDTSEGMDIASITPLVFGLTLKLAGFSHAEFARHIRRSRSYVGSIINNISPLRLRHVMELQQFLGDRLYGTALGCATREAHAIEQRRMEALQYRAERARQQREAEEQARAKRRERRAELLASRLNSSPPEEAETSAAGADDEDALTATD